MEKKRIPEESWFKSVLRSRREPSIRHRSSSFYAAYQPNVHQFPDGISHISPTNNYNQKIKMLYCWHSYLPDPYYKAGVRLQYIEITSWKAHAYGIFTRVGEVSEIEIVSAATE